MNTKQTNYLYNLIFSMTKYNGNGYFLGNKAFIRLNNKLAQVEFLKGNKIGNYERGLRDITIKVKLKSASANNEEIEACMSFYDETDKSFLVDFDTFSTILNEDIMVDELSGFFSFVGKFPNRDMADSFVNELEEGSRFLEELAITGEETDEELNEKITNGELLEYFCEIGENISAFLDFLFSE